MTDIDWTRLPGGERGWRDFVAGLRLGDDRDERYFIEYKSDVDLNTKEDRAKVAKFILGAANRDPERSRQRLEGYAVMILGIGPDGPTGIAGFEAKDLERDVTKYIGADGPRWDFERISMGTGRDVIAIFVDPPTNVIWPCRTERSSSDDAALLDDGAVYRRGDGETRKATGDELMDMVRRMRSAPREVAIGVSVLQGAIRFDVDASICAAHVERHRSRLMWAHDMATARTPKPKNELSRLMAGASSPLIGEKPEPRNRGQYVAEIDAWEKEFVKAWPRFLDDVVAAAGPCTIVQISNLTDTFLEDVQLELRFDVPVHPVEHDPELADDGADVLRRLPEPPRTWGPVSVLGGVEPLSARDLWRTMNLPSPRLDLDVREEEGATTLTFRIGTLRPRQVLSLGENDLTLVVRGQQAPSLTATWSVTAKDHHTVYSGTCEVPVADAADWTSIVSALLAT